MPEKKLTNGQKIVRMLELMDKICYRLDALEMWTQVHDDNAEKIRKEREHRIKDTKDFVEELAVVRAQTRKALSGEISAEEILKTQSLFDAKSIDKLRAMVERQELTQTQPQNIKEKNEIEDS